MTALYKNIIEGLVNSSSLAVSMVNFNGACFLWEGPMIEKSDNSKIKTKKEGETIPEVYTNAVLTNMTPYEFEVTLGLGSSNYEGVKPLVNVRMSPQFAKEFSKLLQQNVKLFEERFGEIPVYQEMEM